MFQRRAVRNTCSKMMPLIYLSILALFASSIYVPATSTTRKDGFEYFGSWSNVTVSQGEDPHAYGYTLQLWKNNGKPVGFLSEYVGPGFDPPIGPLQDVTLDTNTGKITFTAKMTTGLVFSPAHKDGTPAKSLYIFTGTLREGDVSGALEMQDRLDGGASTQTQVLLKRDNEQISNTSFWAQKTFQEWEEYYAPIVRARGPKW